MKFWSLLLISAVALQGCATMTADECATADWGAIGFDDGTKGATLAKIDRRENACTKHGHAINRSAYDDGRHEGLSLYCTPGNGYKLGEAGRNYNGVCGVHDEYAFLEAHNRGFELYRFTAAPAAAQAKLASAQKRHDELGRQLKKYWTGYRDEGLTMEEHNEMVLGLWAEHKYLEKEAILYWSFAHRTLQEELVAYRHKVATGDPSIGSLKPRQFPGPEPYEGPTTADAREMLREVFSGLQP